MTTDRRLRNWFDEPVAEHYDDDSSEMFDPAVVARTVDVLVELAGGGRALELGIGTGRVALPLAQRGVGVSGIDLSPQMVAKLREKPGGADLDVTIGDFASTALNRTFPLAYLVFNTINNLTTQEEQVECFRNVGRHLQPGGRFVVEVGVPDLRRLPPGQSFVPFDVADDHLGFDEYDVVRQGLVSHHWTLIDGQWQRLSVPFRYVWPAELDLMARLGDMALEHRWADWDRSPFTSESRKHVSVWRKDG